MRETFVKCWKRFILYGNVRGGITRNAFGSSLTIYLMVCDNKNLFHLNAGTDSTLYGCCFKCFGVLLLIVWMWDNNNTLLVVVFPWISVSLQQRTDASFWNLIVLSWYTYQCVTNSMEIRPVPEIIQQFGSSPFELKANFYILFKLFSSPIKFAKDTHIFIPSSLHISNITAKIWC